MHRTRESMAPGAPANKDQIASCLSGLALTAVVPPPILTLGPVEVQRVSAWLIACLSVNQHAGHFLGVDWQDQTAMSPCF